MYLLESCLPKRHLPISDASILVLEGRRAILPWADLLEAFSSRCDQPAAMNWLAYFLTGKDAKHKHPYLVLELDGSQDRATVQPADIGPENLRSVVLMAEYRIFGLRTRAFVISDGAGMRTVVAPKERRGEVAVRALDAVMQCGAHVALLSYVPGESEKRPIPYTRGRPAEWTERTRLVGAHLPLASTLDATFAQLGKTTRTNLRYYRKRLEKAVPCEFIPDARSLVTPAEYVALNQGSLNPFSDVDFARRMDAARLLPGGFLCGLRTSQGKWLSLAGGWRQDTTTVLHFQANAAGLEKMSLGTAMRSFLIEGEIARGTRELVFYGGTTHSMHHAFPEGPVRDLVIRRHTLRARLMRRLAPFGLAGRSPFGRTNFLGATLSDEGLEWAPARLITARVDSPRSHRFEDANPVR